MEFCKVCDFFALVVKRHLNYLFLIKIKSMKFKFLILFAFLTVNFFQSFSQIDCTGEIPEDYSGKCISLHPNGEIAIKGSYKKGKRNGRFEARYPSGNIQMKAKFKNDEPADEMLTYYESGDLSSRMILGSPLNYMETYYENGNLKTSGKIGTDGLEGIWYTYNEQGMIEDSTDFDELVERELIEFPAEEDDFDPYEGNQELKDKVIAIYNRKLEPQAGSKDELVEFPDVDAQFIGGSVGMQEFISEIVWYPREAREKDIQGVVYISFIVEIDGSISGIKVSRGVHESLDQEAIRVILLMPSWTPAENNGKPVRSRCILPIRFLLD